MFGEIINLYRISVFSSLLCLLLPGYLSAQDCVCPVITQVFVQGQNCNVLSNGNCAVCPGTELTFTINLAERLPNGGNILWYVDTNPNFDPSNGEGTLAQNHALPDIVCNNNIAVRINEFQPFPAIADNNFADSTTGEWIELIGPPGANLGCYILSDGDWTITIPPGTTMPSNGLFVIGYAAHGQVDLDVTDCNCSNFGIPNEVLTLDNQGEYLVLWNGFNYVDAVRYGNPILSNNPPFGNLVTLGAIPTAGVFGCSNTIPIAFPTFTIINTLPLQNYTYEREPDMTGPWKLEQCGSRGRCNVEVDPGLPFSFNYTIPASACGQTLYFKAIIDPYPITCPTWPNQAAAGPFAVEVYCPETLIDTVLCPGESIIVNGTLYNQQNPVGSEVFASFIGCDSTVNINLTYYPVANVEFSNDTTICLGTDAFVNMIFSGDFPLQFELFENNQSLGNFSAPSPGFSLLTSPGDSVFYTILNLVDNHGCVGVADDTLFVHVNNPQVTSSLVPTDICLGESTSLTYTFTGGEPLFDGTYSDGMNTFTFNSSSPYTITLSPQDTTIYTFTGGTDAFGCAIANISVDTVFTYDPLELVNYEVLCAQDKTTFTIALTIAGGLPGGYTITGLSGIWNSSMWESNPLPSNTTFNLEITDGGPCPPYVLTALVDCNCQNTPGILEFQDTLRICEGDSYATTFLEAPVLQLNDTLVYLLYTNPLNPLGSLLSLSNSPSIMYSSGLPTSQLLWFSSMTGPLVSGSLDLSDPCNLISPPIPLYFYPLPEASYTLPDFICGDSCEVVEIFITGQEPTTLNIEWGNPGALQTIVSSPGGSIHPIQLCGDVFEGDLSFQIIEIQDLYCSNTNFPLQSIPHFQPERLVYEGIICDEATLTYHGEIFDQNRLSDTFVLQAQGGDFCDTLVEVRLEYFPLATGDFIAAFCRGTIVTVGNTQFSETNPNGQVLLSNAAESGCDSLVNVNLTFLDFVTEQLDTTICFGATLLINGTSFDASQPSGVVTIAGGSHLGCDSIINVNLQFHPQLTLTLSGQDIICPGEEAFLFLDGTNLTFDLTLTDNLGQNYSLNGLATGQNFGFFPIKSGNFTILEARLPGLDCPVSISGSGTIEVEDLQATIQTISDYNGFSISCFGAGDGSLSLVASATAGIQNFIWSNGATTDTIDNLFSGTYRVTVTSNSGCSIVQSLILNDPPRLRSDARVTPNDCTQSSIRILSVFGGRSPYQWSIDGVNWVDIGQIPPFPNVIPPSPGSVLLEIRDINGCQIDTLLNVPGPPAPLLVNITPDTTIYLGELVLLSINSSRPPLKISWTPPDRLSCTDCEDPIAKPKQTTLYTVSITDDLGCETEASVLIKVIDDATALFVPNAFSPNGDGINDKFLPFGDEIRYSIVSGGIFNRWGNLVWSCTALAPGDLESGWDGSYKGQVLDAGVFTYYFIIQNNETGNQTTYKGDILLMR